MVMSSVAVLQLIRLYKRDLTLEHLEEDVRGRDMVDGRLEILKKVVLLREKDGVDVLTLRGRILVSFFERVRSFFFVAQEYPSR